MYMAEIDSDGIPAKYGYAVTEFLCFYHNIVACGSASPAVVAAFPLDYEIFDTVENLYLISAGAAVPLAEDEAFRPDLHIVAIYRPVAVDRGTVSALEKFYLFEIKVVVVRAAFDRIFIGDEVLF